MARPDTIKPSVRHKARIKTACSLVCSVTLVHLFMDLIGMIYKEHQHTLLRAKIMVGLPHCILAACQRHVQMPFHTWGNRGSESDVLNRTTPERSELDSRQPCTYTGSSHTPLSSTDLSKLPEVKLAYGMGGGAEVPQVKVPLSLAPGKVGKSTGPSTFGCRRKGAVGFC